VCVLGHHLSDPRDSSGLQYAQQSDCRPVTGRGPLTPNAIVLL
jgi:hypothetical protein